MSGNTIRIKRKPTVLAAKNVKVVSDAPSKSKETEVSPARQTLQTGARTARVKMVEHGAELVTNTMRVVMDDDEDVPVQKQKAAPPADAEPPPRKNVAVPSPPPPPPPPKAAPPPPPVREVLGEPTFKFYCYRCGQKLKVPVSWANKMYPCIRCGHDIMIPPPLVGEFW
jgi:hypothetical protein